MTPPNLANLQANPAGLLQWLDGNLLLAGVITNVPNPGLAWVTLTLQPQVPFAQIAVNAAGRPMDIYTLRTNGAGGHNALRGYVCNYTAGGVHPVDLTPAGPFCFTITLNGCTFGVGPTVGAGGGSRRVSHANSGGNTQPQRTQTWGAHGVAANSVAIKMLEPAEYRRLGGGGNLNTTVFGILSAGIWRFYFQLYSAIPGANNNARNYQVHGVFPILGT